MFSTQSLSSVLISYIRGIDRIFDLSISSAVSSALTIGLNILFLVILKLGLVGYFLATIIGPAVQCCYLALRASVHRNICFGENYNAERMEMLAYSIPLIANAIAWWINSVSDRYVVILFYGLAANGIYSIASKIPQILNVFQSIFNQAWVLSAVKEFDADDKSGFFSNTYKAYNCLLVIICSFVIFVDKSLAKILYAKEFYTAWQYVPWLTIAIVFGALSGYLGGFFSAVKKSKAYAKSTLIGAGSNIILNFLFTPIIGPLGAAIATTVSYAIVFAMRFVQSRRTIRIKVNVIRDTISYILMVVQSVALLLIRDNDILLDIVLCSIFLIIVIIYVKDIKLILGVISKKRKKGL